MGFRAWLRHFMREPVLGASARGLCPRRPFGPPSPSGTIARCLCWARAGVHPFLGYALQNVSAWLAPLYAENALRRQVSGALPLRLLCSLPRCLCHYSSITASRPDGCFGISCADCMPKTLLGGSMLGGSAPAAFGLPRWRCRPGANVWFRLSRLRHCRRGCMAGAILCTHQSSVPVLGGSAPTAALQPTPLALSSLPPLRAAGPAFWGRHCMLKNDSGGK